MDHTQNLLQSLLNSALPVVKEEEGHRDSRRRSDRRSSSRSRRSRSRDRQRDHHRDRRDYSHRDSHSTRDSYRDSYRDSHRDRHRDSYRDRDSYKREPRESYKRESRDGDRRDSHRDSYRDSRDSFKRDYQRDSRDYQRDSKRDGERRERKPIRENYFNRDSLVDYSDTRRDRSVTPIHMKKSKLDNWDKVPLGYEGMSAMQVKALGHFPAPGQPSRSLNQMGQLPSHVLPEFMRLEEIGNDEDFFEIDATQEMSEQEKRLYKETLNEENHPIQLFIGGVAAGTTPESLVEYLNRMIMKHNLNLSGGFAAVGAWVHPTRPFALVEFNSHQEASACLSLDGLLLHGLALKMRRPKGYKSADEDKYKTYIPGTISTYVPDTQNRLFIGNLPTYLNDEQVIEMLKGFGELRSFNLIKDRMDGTSKGMAFCEYAKVEATDAACQGLNGMELGEKKLSVQRAAMGSNATKLGQMSQLAVATTGGASVLPPHYLSASAGESTPSPVVLLMNMINEKFASDSSYQQDVQSQVEQVLCEYGQVKSFQFLFKDFKIFVEYSSIDEAERALKASAGRLFDDRTVIGMFFPLDKFKNQVYLLD